MSTESDGDRPRSFTLCPSCGRLTPSGVVECVECGQPIAALVAAAAEQRSEELFAVSVFTRAVPATWAIIGANVAVFALMAYAAGSVDPASFRYQEALINFGAKIDSAIGAGEYWRLVTPMFLHIGAVHLFVNMYSLYVLGPQVERLFGTSRFVVMYVLSGIGGVLGSYGLDRAFSSAESVSAGASGALFGLMGILLVFGLRRRDELPGIFKNLFSPRAFMPVLLLNLFITFAIPNIDKGAHVGGLAVGAALGVLVPFARPGERRAGLLWWAAALLAALTVAVSFSYAYRTADPIPDTERFIRTYNDSNSSMAAAEQSVLTAANRSAVPASDAARFADAAGAIDPSVALDASSRELLVARKELLERAAAFLGERRSDLTPATAEEFARDVDENRKAWDGWLEENGTRFRLVKTSDDTNTSGGNDGNS